MLTSARGAVRALALAAALAFAAILALPGAAAAHADLLGSTPADRAVLAGEPHELTLLFSEKVTLALSSVTVVAPNGHRIDHGISAAAGSGGDRIRVLLAPDPAHGTFVVTWRTTAADDGHTTTGALTFSVGAPSRTADAAGGTGGHDRLTSAVLDVAIWLGFAGLACMVGFTAVRLYCLPEADAAADRVTGTGATTDVHAVPEAAPPAWDRMRWPAAAGWAVLLAGSVLQLFAYGPASQGESLGHAFDRSLLSASLSTHVGHTLVARIMLLALVAAVGEGVLRHRRASGGALAAALTLLLALTWSEISHAPSGPLVPLAVLVTTLHVTAMAVWAGGVATFVVLLTPTRAGDPVLTAAAARFSRLALGSVVVLAATGLFQACREVGGVGDLTGTHYGRLLLVKVALVLAVLATAAASHARVRRRREPTGVLAVRRAVLLELAGITAVLVVTVMLIGTAPTR